MPRVSAANALAGGRARHRPAGPAEQTHLLCRPLAGTAMFGSNRYAVYFLSPLTGGYGECYSGGNVTPQFAQTGYKVVIVEGASRPGLRRDHRSGATIHPAADLWGLDTYQAEEKLVAHGPQSASLRDRTRRREPGALRLHREQQVAQPRARRPGRGHGLQEVKGMVFHGGSRSRSRGRTTSRRWSRTWRTAARTTPAWPPTGAAARSTWCASLNNAGTLPHPLLARGQPENSEPLTAETMSRARHPATGSARPASAVPQEEHRAGGSPPRRPADRGAGVRDGLRVRRLCEIVDFGEIMWLNDICDRQGVDTMSAGNLCGLAIEACATRNHRPDAGAAATPRAWPTSSRKVIRREGIGDLFADGVGGRAGARAAGSGRTRQGHGACRLRSAQAQGHGPGLRHRRRAAPATCAPRSTRPSSRASSSPQDIDGKAAM